MKEKNNELKLGIISKDARTTVFTILGHRPKLREHYLDGTVDVLRSARVITNDLNGIRYTGNYYKVDAGAGKKNEDNKSFPTFKVFVRVIPRALKYDLNYTDLMSTVCNYFLSNSAPKENIYIMPFSLNHDDVVFNLIAQKEETLKKLLKYLIDNCSNSNALTWITPLTDYIEKIELLTEYVKEYKEEYPNSHYDDGAIHPKISVEEVPNERSITITQGHRYKHPNIIETYSKKEGLWYTASPSYVTFNDILLENFVNEDTKT